MQIATRVQKPSALSSGSSSKYLVAETDSSESGHRTDRGIPHPDQFIWFELYQRLSSSEQLQSLFLENLPHLFVSKQRFDQIKNKDPVFESLVNRYLSRNCLKAISVACDLSTVKINQYKFLFRGFTLGTAVKLLIKESMYLYKSLLKREHPMKELKRLVTNWINYLILIHNVHESAHSELRNAILEYIELSLQVSTQASSQPSLQTSL